MSTAKVHPPFTIQSSPNLAEILDKLNASIAVTTYQAGKLVFIGAKNDHELSQLPRNFNKAMGISFKDDFLLMATKDEVVVFKNVPELAKTYPNAPDTYDALYMPRIKYYTGVVDIHDVHWAGDEMLGINTSFSCLVKLDKNYNFTPIWQPHFISDLVAEDRCHMNGLVIEGDKAKYITALGSGNTAASWRENITESGILMSVEENKILLDGLAMPHSPLMYNGELYFLQSANGNLCKYNTDSDELEVVYSHNKFVRGLSIVDDIAFVAHSKLRKNSSTFSKLKIADTSAECGIEVIHLPTRQKIAWMHYLSSVDEIYDLKVLQGIRRANILNTQKDIHSMGLEIPNKTFWAKSSE